MSILKEFNSLDAYLTSLGAHRHSLSNSRQSVYNGCQIWHTLYFWSFVVRDLLGSKNISCESVSRRLQNFITAVDEADFLDVANAGKEGYSTIILLKSEKLRSCTYGEFKARLQSVAPSLDIGRFLSPVSDDISVVLNSRVLVDNGVYRANDADALTRLAQFFLFPSKTNLDREELRSDALASYLEAEAECANLDIERIPTSLLERAQDLIKGWLGDWKYHGDLGRHGGGSVADSGRAKYSKYNALVSDVKLDHIFLHDPFAPEYAMLPYIKRSVRGGKRLDRCSKLCFVPKNFAKLRSISMEPAALQFTQQGVMCSLYRYFKKTKYHGIGQHLRLWDQSQNQGLAYHGSITNEYATIDSSHASDSVSWKLVKVLFKKVPQLLKWLIATRSSHTLLPTGTRLELSKFAPMGSALCFPIESIIFLVISYLGVERAMESGKDVDPETGYHRGNFISVYGDDVIIPSWAYEEVINYLRLFGFTPNAEKSYGSGPFKESCGGNYYCGTDITPIKFQLKLDEIERDEHVDKHPMLIGPPAYSALIAYANMAYARGYSLLRCAIIHRLMSCGYQPLFASDSSLLERGSCAGRSWVDGVEKITNAIYSTHATNFHLQREVDLDCQRIMVKHTAVGTVQRGKPKATDQTVKGGLYEALRQENPNAIKLTNGFVVHGNTIDTVIPETSHISLETGCSVRDGASQFCESRLEFTTGHSDLASLGESISGARYIIYSAQILS